MSYKATEKYKRIQNMQSAKMYYRGDGWPGKNSLSDGQKTVEYEHLGSLFETMFSSQIFKNPACRECRDHFAETADISFCDYWNADERKTEKEGNSCIIVRSKRAKEIVELMRTEGYIEVVKELDEQDIVQTQFQVLQAKKGNLCNKFRYRAFVKGIDYIFGHGIYQKFDLKTYQWICACYGRICSKSKI